MTYSKYYSIYFNIKDNKGIFLVNAELIITPSRNGPVYYYPKSYRPSQSFSNLMKSVEPYVVEFLTVRAIPKEEFLGPARVMNKTVRDALQDLKEFETRKKETEHIYNYDWILGDVRVNAGKQNIDDKIDYIRNFLQLDVPVLDRGSIPYEGEKKKKKEVKISTSIFEDLDNYLDVFGDEVEEIPQNKLIDNEQFKRAREEEKEEEEEEEKEFEGMVDEEEEEERRLKRERKQEALKLQQLFTANDLQDENEAEEPANKKPYCIIC